MLYDKIGKKKGNIVNYYKTAGIRLEFSDASKHQLSRDVNKGAVNQ